MTMNQNRARSQRRLSIPAGIALTMLLLCSLAVAQRTPAPTTQPDPVSKMNLAIVAAERELAVDIYRELARDEAQAGKNLLYAPHSLFSGLSMFKSLSCH